MKSGLQFLHFRENLIYFYGSPQHNIHEYFLRFIKKISKHSIYDQNDLSHTHNIDKIIEYLTTKRPPSQIHPDIQHSTLCMKGPTMDVGGGAICPAPPPLTKGAVLQVGISFESDMWQLWQLFLSIYVTIVATFLEHYPTFQVRRRSDV